MVVTLMQITRNLFCVRKGREPKPHFCAIMTWPASAYMEGPPPETSFRAFSALVVSDDDSDKEDEPQSKD